MYEIYQGISHPGCIPAYPGYGYMHRDLYETITSSHLTLQTKQGRIKNFKLSGVTRQVETTGAQLFDAGTAKDSYYIKDDTGEESTTATQKDKFASDYIPVSGIESITFNAETAWGAWYDASKLYISGFGSSGAGRTLVVPENAAYMRFTGNIENKNVIMLNAGETALPWEPYTGATSSPSPEYPQNIQGVGVRTNNEPYGYYRTDVVCRTEDDTESYTAPIYTREPVYDGDSIQLVSGQYCHVRNVGAQKYHADTVWSVQTEGHISTPRMYIPANCTADKMMSTFCKNSDMYVDSSYLNIATTLSLEEFAAIVSRQEQTVTYPLPDPIIEPLPAISQAAICNLKTYKGTTVIDTTDPLEPEITVSYRAQTDYSKLPGLEADYEKGIFTRLGAAKNLTAGAQFNRFPMYAGRRRCNVLDDGTIAAYYGDPTYTEDGSNGQVMVYQPKFYYQVVPLKLEPQTDGIGYHLRRAQYWVSHKPQPGFKLHPAFKKPAQKLEYIMYSAFEGSIYDTSAAAYILDDAQVMDVAADKLSSIAGAKPASGKTQQFTRPNVEQLAQNRGSGWHGDTIKAESANQLLMAIELGTMNTQAAIGQGVASIPDTPNTENNSIITGGTSSLGSNTGMADGTNGKVSVAYRGVENPWGNIWKQVYGVNIWGDGSMKGGVPYICTDYDFAESKDTGNYESAGFTLANANGYISAMGYSEACDWLFLPSETLGNSFMPVGDYYYCIPDLNGYRISLLGGSWFGGDIAGGFFWGLNNGVGGRSRGIGSRLIYVPQ